MVLVLVDVMNCVHVVNCELVSWLHSALPFDDICILILFHVYEFILIVFLRISKVCLPVLVQDTCLCPLKKTLLVEE